MNPRYFVMQVNGKFCGGKYFTLPPVKGGVFSSFGQWYEIVAVKDSIDVICVEQIQYQCGLGGIGRRPALKMQCPLDV